MKQGDVVTYEKDIINGKNEKVPIFNISNQNGTTSKMEFIKGNYGFK